MSVVTTTTESAVNYIGGGKWSVSQDGVQVGLMVQGISQSWFAYRTDANGERTERRTINGNNEYGGRAYPYTIANEMITW